MMSTRVWFVSFLILVAGTIGSRPLSLAALPSGTAYARDGAPVYKLNLIDGGVELVPFGGVFVSSTPFGMVTSVNVADKLTVGGVTYVPIRGLHSNYIRMEDALYKK